MSCKIMTKKKHKNCSRLKDAKMIIDYMQYVILNLSWTRKQIL